eukprot:Gregarina_sp_Poly_1__4139@NODE_2266_length_2381_cov_171_633967_g1453_i0_p1_GENE_NODE_2266_length_2381_cov_171_633967_g1453_i0NODE_2266_length_2381_cov_171_633967_g1453_i0_p1_ORF_typecomplete_len261_score14_82_NODE_2266_length_2381_cov_171_633967_g1453_i0138920
MYFQARLQCVDSAGGKCSEEECAKLPIKSPWHDNEYDNQCASNISRISSIPGADECCCPQAAINLLAIAKVPQSNAACTQHRKCQFLCCSDPARFCGLQCCQKDELCGEGLQDNKACCVAPYPRVVPSVNAPDLVSIFHLQSQHSCCAYGVGRICSTGAPCCLDTGNNHCLTIDECDSAGWEFPRTLMMIIWPIFITFTLIGCLTVGTGIWRVSVGSNWARVNSGVQSIFNREHRSNDELTSGGIYGNTSSILSQDDDTE